MERKKFELAFQESKKELLENLPTFQQRLTEELSKPENKADGKFTAILSAEMFTLCDQYVYSVLEKLLEVTD